MRTETRKAFGWWAIIALAILALNLLACGGCASVPKYQVNHIFVELNQDDGRTYCTAENTVLVAYDIDVVKTRFFKYVVIHEGIHAEQLKKDCFAGMKRYRDDPAYRIKMEQEAYCTAGYEMVNDGFPADSVRKFVKAVLLQRYGADSSKVNCNLPNIPFGAELLRIDPFGRPP